ncbi:MauE/DoxX family redox-associated membrane protein [Emticicia sp. TH156]|uniref:MauE/DoxX family redox-associated membrane protein n=1 Tax=Emticicia sp. TH156 TaxID=2067454 RepID=UPI000C777831|nr:MauE/DoxX family redox-associated membrane protein [Emticicia sp. TH156]PLK45783.1 hypothetical protein C0V77_00030 [Emticicia sp. TH156]
MRLKIIILLLLALWIPVFLDKIIDFTVFKTEILRQPFSDKLGYILIYTLPVLEGLTILFLLMVRMQYYGLLLSLLLMTIFTVYIGLALLGAWEKLPCSCGSVISGMSWRQHFLFNLFFTALSGWGFYLMQRKRSSNAGGGAAKGLPA